MTGITREYLDALALRYPKDVPGIAPGVPDLVAALRRVLDLHADRDQDGHCDECGERRPCPTRATLAGTQTERCINCSSPTCDGEACAESPYQPRAGTQTESLPEPDRSASCSTCGHARGAHFSGQCIGNRNLCGCLVFAGTQTDDGAGDAAPTEGVAVDHPVNAEPAPSSPDRIEGLARALCAAPGNGDQSPDWEDYLPDARTAVEWLDAYDREHLRPGLTAFVQESTERYLRERIAADIEAMPFIDNGGTYDDGWNQAWGQARHIVRGES